MKNYILLAGGIIILGMVSFASCTKDNKEEQIPNPTVCDTVAMKYATDIVPILEQYCYGCHGQGNTGGSGGIDLGNYQLLSARAKNGDLLGVITHASGYPAMPSGQPKLDDCTIAKITNWVNQGSPNN